MAHGYTRIILVDFVRVGLIVDDLLPDILKDISDALLAITDALKILDARMSVLEHE